jgi:hypothetical protein
VIITRHVNAYRPGSCGGWGAPRRGRRRQTPPSGVGGHWLRGGGLSLLATGAQRWRRTEGLAAEPAGLAGQPRESKGGWPASPAGVGPTLRPDSHCLGWWVGLFEGTTNAIALSGLCWFIRLRRRLFAGGRQAGTTGTLAFDYSFLRQLDLKFRKNLASDSK